MKCNSEKKKESQEKETKVMPATTEIYKIEQEFLLKLREIFMHALALFSSLSFYSALVRYNENGCSFLCLMKL